MVAQWWGRPLRVRICTKSQAKEYTVGGRVLLLQAQEDNTHEWRSGAYGVLVSSMLGVDVLNPQPENLPSVRD